MRRYKVGILSDASHTGSSHPSRVGFSNVGAKCKVYAQLNIMPQFILTVLSVFECLSVLKLKLPLVVGVSVKRDSRASEPI